MQGKTAVITGATSGIGQAAAEALARQGARIIFPARDPRKAAAMLERLRGLNPGAEHACVQADLSVIASTVAAGRAILELAPAIHVLINNAGGQFAADAKSRDGIDLTFAVNHMAYFVLTETLRPALPAGARIVSTASEILSAAAYARLARARNPQMRAMGAYFHSKLANVRWTVELARRLAGTGVTANAVHPGGVRTNIGENAGGLLKLFIRVGGIFLHSPESGAAPIIHLAAAPEVEGRTGVYHVRFQPKPLPAHVVEPAALGALWTESEALMARAIG